MSKPKSELAQTEVAEATAAGYDACKQFWHTMRAAVKCEEAISVMQFLHGAKWPQIRSEVRDELKRVTPSTESMHAWAITIATKAKDQGDTGAAMLIIAAAFDEP